MAVPAPGAARGARGETRSRRTPRAAPGAGTAIGGDHPRGSQGGPRRLLTFERVGEGGKLHALPVEEAHTLPGAPGTGVEQQSGGELDASRGVGPEELDPRRQPAGRTEGGGNFVDRGELPPDEDSDPRLPGRRPARYWRRFHPAPRRLHPRGVGCSAVVARRCQGGVPLTDTLRIWGGSVADVLIISLAVIDQRVWRYFGARGRKGRPLAGNTGHFTPAPAAPSPCTGTGDASTTAGSERP